MLSGQACKSIDTGSPTAAPMFAAIMTSAAAMVIAQATSVDPCIRL